jgi:hypothetical protein
MHQMHISKKEEMKLKVCNKTTYCPETYSARKLTLPSYISGELSKGKSNKNFLK